MTTVLTGVVVALVVNMLAGLWRVVRGPGSRDRLSGLLLLATTGSAALLTLAALLDQSALRDATLVLVALATVVVVVRVSGDA